MKELQPNYTLIITCTVIALLGIWLGLQLAQSGIHPTADTITVYEDYSIDYNGYAIPSVKGY